MYMDPNVDRSIITIAKIQKQPKCPSTDEWYMCMYVYTHACTCNGVLLNHKKEWDSAIYNKMNGPRGFEAY